MNLQNAHYRIDTPYQANICDLSRRLIVNCSGMTVLSSPFQSAYPVGRHDYYLMYMLEGRLDLRINEVQGEMIPGRMIIYPPDQLYAYGMQEFTRMAYLWVHFTGSGVASLLGELGLETSHIYSLRDGETIEEDIAALHRLFITRPLFWEDELASLMEQILIHIARDIGTPDDALSIARIQTSLHHLNTHYAEPLRLETLANMEYLSPSRYSALFRQITGRSPQHYLIELRMRNARDLLAATNLSVSEVARSVGYDDPLYFSRLFRQHFGLPPKAVRTGACKINPDG